MSSAAGAGFEYLDVDRALEQVGEIETLHEMLDMLQSSLDRDVPQINAFLAQGDAKGANRLLHALKGFIPIFCVDDLCEHVALVELISKTANAVDIATAFAPLEPKLRQLQAEIDAHMA
jgi:HPt (histidine-containing phosphotransfer) domain-containing protein